MPIPSNICFNSRSVSFFPRVLRSFFSVLGFSAFGAFPLRPFFAFSSFSVLTCGAGDGLRVRGASSVFGARRIATGRAVPHIEHSETEATQQEYTKEIMVTS